MCGKWMRVVAIGGAAALAAACNSATNDSSDGDVAGDTSAPTSSGGPTTDDASSSQSSTSGATNGTGSSGDSTGPNGDSESHASTGSEGSTGDGSAGTESSTGHDASTGDGPSDPLAVYDDAFDDPSTLDDWTFRHEHESTPSQIDTIEVSNGFLRVVPHASGWYDAFTGIFMFRVLEGDFMVETWVAAGHVAEPSVPPTRTFNSAGLLIRDPVGANGNWVMHNVGHQGFVQMGDLIGVATEGKTTTNSSSMLWLVEGAHQGRLRICRLGDDVILTRWLDGEDGFIQTHAYERADLPLQLQVGLVVNGWNSTGAEPDLELQPDILARFDYIRFRTIASESDCLTP